MLFQLVYVTKCHEGWQGRNADVFSYLLTWDISVDMEEALRVPPPGPEY